MRAGDLNQRVTIQSPAVVADEFGKSAPATWSTVATVHASVRPLRAVEILRAQQAGQESTLLVRIRYRDDVTASCRLLWQGRQLQIAGVIDVDARKWQLEIMASERAEP